MSTFERPIKNVLLSASSDDEWVNESGTDLDDTRDSPKKRKRTSIRDMEDCAQLDSDQRRQYVNRIAAQKLRDKKKRYILELQTTVRALQSEQDTIQETIERYVCIDIFLV